MFTIGFDDKDFFLTIDDIDEYDEDAFNNYVNFLRSRYISYSGDKYWKIPYKRIDEMIAWFNYYEYEYNLLPKVKIELNNFKEKNFKRETIFNRSAKINTNVLKDNVKLFNFQIDGCNWVLKRNRGYIADDAGLGKTIESIQIFSQLYDEGKIDSIFLVVRIGTSYSWKKEILEFSNIFKEEDIVIILNNDKVKPFERYKNKKIIIISNHLSGDVFASYKKGYKKGVKKSKLKWNKPSVNILKEWNKKSIALFVDEAHELKNTKALRTKSLLAHKEFFSYRYLLSATPAINKWEDWWAGLNLIDESILSMSENAFMIYLAKDIGNKWSMYNINEYDEKKIKIVKDKMSIYVIQRLKKDQPEMKAKQIMKPIYLNMTSKQEKIYKLFTDTAIKQLEDEYDNVTEALVFEKYFPYFLQIIENPLLLEGKIKDDKFNTLLSKWKFEDDPKFEYTKHRLKSCIEDLDEKVVLFDHHPKTLDALNKKFQKYNPIIVHGGTKETEESKQHKQDLFNDKNSGHMLFLLSSKIGGASWNLNKACRRELFYNLPYDGIITRQALDRVHRITSIYDSIIEMLIIDKTIDYHRYMKNIKRININDNFINKNLSVDEIRMMFNGSFF